ncbi:MAG TPA: restriction endonuclease [Tepidisphaeraceae bacterium]
MARPRAKDDTLSGYMRFFAPILEVLRELGGSARSAQVKDQVTDRLAVSEAERAEVLKNGVSRIGNQIDWARFYLAKAGYLDSSKRGVWALTEKGRNSRLSVEDVREMVRTVAATSIGAPKVEDESASLEDPPVHQADHRATLLNTIKALPARGFEELSRYLLLESGFEDVSVTGRSGDGGIDGHGVLRVSKLVSMKVLFQCKRYAEAVGPSVVRDFRGSLAGRAEKGIILTTGYFTSAAEQEARREGVVPIELVDGERLVELFEEMEIGLKNPRSVYDVDDDFFARFRSES